MPMNPRLLRPLASGFNPRSIAGLVAWWDSTDNSTITTSTGVSVWRDKVNSYTLEQSTGANQPTLSTINGKQAFDYNGSSQFLTSTDAGLVAEAAGASVNDHSMFYVAEVDFADNAYPAAFASSSLFSPISAGVHPLAAGNVWRLFYRSDNNTTGANAASATTYSLGVPYVVSATTGASIVGRVNGTEIAAATNNAASLAFSPNLFGVGCYARGTPTGFLDGRIGDVLIYNRVLTTAEIQRVERWLAGKFGVALA